MVACKVIDPYKRQKQLKNVNNKRQVAAANFALLNIKTCGVIIAIIIILNDVFYDS